MNPIEKMILVMMKRDLTKVFALEESLTQVPEMTLPIADAPERSWPLLETFTSGDQLPYTLKAQTSIAKYMVAAGAQTRRAINSLGENPAEPRTQIESEELEALIQSAYDQGVGSIGFTRLPQKLIFKRRAILFDSAIVLTRELTASAVQTSPSLENYVDSIRSYDELGAPTNDLVDQLRKLGFAAQASHPLGGLVLYPPLAAQAGLGKIGRHGLLITPEFGPRQRISAIFTSIENLPFVNETAIEKEGCEDCGRCMAACPVGAFFPEPHFNDEGRRTSVDQAKCSKEFGANNACSVCMKVCAQVNPGNR